MFSTLNFHVDEELFLNQNSYLNLQMIDYKAAEDEAKKSRSNIWEYGDITEDDAKEFGVGR